MPKEVDIDGLGIVEFPDEMSDEEIGQTLTREAPKIRSSLIGDWMGRPSADAEKALSDVPMAEQLRVLDSIKAGPAQRISNEARLGLRGKLEVPEGFGMGPDQSIHEMLLGRPQTAAELNKASSQALIELPPAPEGANKFEQTGNAIYNAVAKPFVESFTTPKVVGGMAIGGVGGRIAQRGVAGTFALDIVKEAPHAISEAFHSFKDPDATYQQKLESVLGAATTVILPGLLAKHAIAPKVKPTKPSVIEEAAVQAEAAGAPATAAALRHKSKATPEIKIETPATTEPAAPQQTRYSVAGLGEVEVLDTNRKTGRATVRIASDPQARPQEVRISEVTQLEEPIEPAEVPPTQTEMRVGEQSVQLKPDDLQLKPEVDQVKGPTLPTEQADIDLAIQGNRDAGLPADVVFSEKLPAGNPFANVRATIDIDGTIVLNRDMIRESLADLAPPERQAALNAIIREEGIHATAKQVIPDADIEGLWKSLTPLDRALTSKSYAGNFKGLKPDGTPFSDSQMGHEYLRRQMERLMGMSPREVVEARGTGWLTEKTIDVIERVIAGVRKLAGTKVSADLESMLGKLEENIKAAKEGNAGEIVPRGNAETPTKPAESPETFRKPKKEQGQEEMVLPVAAAGEQRPSAVELGAVEAKRITPAEVDAAITSHLTEAKRPRFGDFFEAIKEHAPELQRGQLHDAWEDAVWRHLQEASGADLAKLRDAMGVREAVQGEGRGRISDPRADLPRAEQQVRSDVTARIAEKLLREADAERTTIRRGKLEPSDIGWWREQEGGQPAFTEIKGKPDPTALVGDAAVDRTGRTAPPRSVTKRVTALADAVTGGVDLVSTYKASNGDVYITDPSRVAAGNMRTGVPLKQLMAMKATGGKPRYTATHSILLDEPVQGFHQHFASAAEFKDQFVDAAERDQARRLESAAEAPALIDRPPEPRGTLESRERLTDAEAGSILDAAHDEVGELNAPSDFQALLDGLKARATDGTLTARDRQAISGLRKTIGDTDLETAFKELYDDAKASNTRGEFIRRRLEAHGPDVAGDREAGTGRPAPGEAAGAFDPADIGGTEQSAAGPMAFWKPAGRKMSEIVSTMLLGPTRFYSEWMVDRLNRAGGPRSKELAEHVKGSISEERRYYGDLSISSLDRAKKEAGKFGKATAWMHQLVEVTDRTAIINAAEAMEGTTPVPTYAQPLNALAQHANFETGQMIQPVTPGFIPSGAFQRNLNGFGLDVIRRGAGKVWQDMVNGNAIANNVPVWEAERFFKNWKEVLDDTGARDQATRLESVNQDFKRVFPRAITHVKVDSLLGDHWEPVLHSDLFNYLENTAQRATHIRAFREMVNSLGANFNDVLRDVRAELGPDHQADLNALMNALQGHPTDSYAALGRVGLAPTQLLGATLRNYNATVGNTMAKLALTGQMVTQAGETIAGATPVFFGYENTIRGMARVKELYPELERIGAVNRVVYDNSFDANSPLRSTFRIIGNTIAKRSAQNFLNELQEATAAATARVVRDRIEAGTLTDWERSMLPETFRAMSFTRAQAADMIAGRAPELMDRFERQAAAWLTGGNKAIAQGSVLGANRLFNSVFRFQQYPMTKFNQFRRVTAGMFEPGRTPAERFRSARLWTRFMFGSTLQGALTVGISSLLYNQLFGTQIALAEAEDEPFDFLLSSGLATMGGPAYPMMRGAQNGGIIGVGEQAARMIFPYSVVSGIWQATSQDGGYKDLDTQDRIGMFVNRQIPGSRIIKSGMALVGLSQNDRELDTAIRAFYRWKAKEIGTEKEDVRRKTEDLNAGFRQSMKKAVNALKIGDTAGYLQNISDAASEPGKKTKDIKASLNGRRFLKDLDGKKLTPEEMDSLRSRIGDRAFQKLIYFNAMLEAASKHPLNVQ